MVADAVDMAYVAALEARLTQGTEVDQRLARRHGLDVKFMQETAAQAWRVLEGSELFVPLRSHTADRYRLGTQRWLEMAEAKGFGDTCCLRFGGYRRAMLAQSLPTWTSTLRLVKRNMITDISRSEVEVFLTKDNAWIVYRGPVDDNPDAEFMNQFGDVMSMCNFLQALDLGEYKFEVPSPALALTDQLLTFVEEHHALLRAKAEATEAILKECGVARSHFADWRPLL